MKRGAKLAIAHGVVGVVVLAVVVALWLRDGDEARDAPEPVLVEPVDTDPTSAAPPARAGASAPGESAAPPGVVEEAGEVAAPPPLPPLDESDSLVRSWLAERVPSAWDAWLINADLVRLAAVALEYAARGLVPRRSLSFIAVARFTVREEAAGVFIHADSFVRYDPIVDLALAVPAQDAATLFALIEPLLAEAVAELGVREPSPRDLLERAMDQVLATPVLAEPVALARPGVYYEFADPRLEARSDLQKQLLRMGAANVGRVRGYAERLRAALAAR